MPDLSLLVNLVHLAIKDRSQIAFENIAHPCPSALRPLGSLVLTTTGSVPTKGWATSVSCAVRPWGPAKWSAWSALVAS